MLLGLLKFLVQVMVVFLCFKVNGSQDSSAPTMTCFLLCYMVYLANSGDSWRLEGDVGLGTPIAPVSQCSPFLSCYLLFGYTLLYIYMLRSLR